MIYNSYRELSQNYDFIIAGAGTAGISLAYELSKHDYSILLIESGEFIFDKFNDSLKNIEQSGLPIKESSRERVVGGNTTTWGGLIAPLDKIDLEAKDWIADSGWPFDYEELIQYYEKIDESYEFPSFEFFKHDGMSELNQKTSNLVIKNFTPKLFLASKPEPNFQKIFKKLLEVKVDILINHTLEEVIMTDDHIKVKAFKVFDKDKSSFLIENAKQFILALNSIENARVLLNSNTQIKQGVGNKEGIVGKYFMNHPKDHFGTIDVHDKSQDLSRFWGFMFKGYAGFNAFRLEEKTQKEEKTLNSYIRFEPLYSWTDNEGVKSFVRLNKTFKFFYKRFQAKNKNEVVSLRDFSETDDEVLPIQSITIKELLSNLFKISINIKIVFEYIFFRLSKNKTPKLKGIRLRNIMEMAPNIKNRIDLSTKNDFFGYPIAKVVSNFSDIDKQTVISLHKILKTNLKQMNFGIVKSNLEQFLDNWPIRYDSSHHLGTTRMGNNKETSVVDKNLKVHDVENLYIAGGSVFPTSGNANPTYTIVALSVRLSEYLSKKVSK